jgi:hypothetical protein
MRASERRDVRNSTCCIERLRRLSRLVARIRDEAGCTGPQRSQARPGTSIYCHIRPPGRFGFGFHLEPTAGAPTARLNQAHQTECQWHEDISDVCDEQAWTPPECDPTSLSECPRTFPARGTIRKRVQLTLSSLRRDDRQPPSHDEDTIGECVSRAEQRANFERQSLNKNLFKTVNYSDSQPPEGGTPHCSRCAHSGDPALARANETWSTAGRLQGGASRTAAWAVRNVAPRRLLNRHQEGVGSSPVMSRSSSIR